VGSFASIFALGRFSCRIESSASTICLESTGFEFLCLARQKLILAASTFEIRIRSYHTFGFLACSARLGSSDHEAACLYLLELALARGCPSREVRSAAWSTEAGLWRWPSLLASSCLPCELATSVAASPHPSTS
jgi:hypothetical protein